jgi:integrase
MKGPTGIANCDDVMYGVAMLALKGGARIEQVQFSLGHASTQTTERYPGVEQDLIDGPSDQVRLRIVGLGNAPPGEWT